MRRKILALRRLARLSVALFLALTACDRGAREDAPSAKDVADASPGLPTSVAPGTSGPAEDVSAQSDSAITPEELVIVEGDTKRDAELMSGGPLEQRQAAAERLLQTASDESLAALVAVLNGSDPETKAALGQWLTEANVEGMRDRLLRVLPLADRETARALAFALGARADADFIATVVETLDYAGSRRAEENLLAVVRRATSPEASGVLRQVVMDKKATEPLVIAAAQALVASGTPASVDGVIGKIDSTTDPDEIAGLSAILAETSDPRVHQTLIYAAEGNKAARNPTTRAAAIRALANYPTHGTMELMRRLQSDSDAVVREAAASVLATSQR